MSESAAIAEPVQDYAWAHSLAPNLLDDPYAMTEDVLRDCPPVFYAPGGDGRSNRGMWVATRYEPIREIFQNDTRYSSVGVYPFFAAIGEDLRAIPLSFDAPDHTRYRKFLEPWFTPKAVLAMHDRIRANVDQLIDTFVDTGECDAAYDFGRVYPVRVIMEMMGFPSEMFEQFLSWSHPMHFEMHLPERMAWGARQALEYIRSFIVTVRAKAPDDTLASYIVHGTIDGVALTDDEVTGMVYFLWDGGMDTVAATSSLIFRRLALDPALQQQLRDTPAKLANAVEEFLRMNPTVNTVRIARDDHVLEGCEIKAGDALLCLVAAGNFDPEKYEDPRKFRLDRAQNRHFTFVAGIHRCLGINLARYELRIALAEFLRRIPPFRLKPGAQSLAMPGLMGAQQVPIVWDAA